MPETRRADKLHTRIAAQANIRFTGVLQKRGQTSSSSSRILMHPTLVQARATVATHDTRQEAHNEVRRSLQAMVWQTSISADTGSRAYISDTVYASVRRGVGGGGGGRRATAPLYHERPQQHCRLSNEALLRTPGTVCGTLVIPASTLANIQDVRSGHLSA